MAAADPAETEGDPFKDSVSPNSLFRVRRAAGVEAASARQEGRHQAAVSRQRQKQDRAYHGVTTGGAAKDG